MKMFLTGVSGYLGRLVVEMFDELDCVETMVGIDIKEPSFKSSKLEFHSMDVRSNEISRFMYDCDVCLHMAFILDEIRDKDLTHDININGGKNIFHSCIEAGVPRIIQLSSMAAFGAHSDNKIPFDEDDFPRGHPECYYPYAKAELEHYLMWLQKKNPDLKVTVLRPCVVVGESIDNTVMKLFSYKVAASIKGCEPMTQYISERDLAEAIRLVVEKEAIGTYHVTSDDMITLKEMQRMAGIIAPPLPRGFLSKTVDLAYALRLSDFSSHWIKMFFYPMVGSNEKIKKELGWKPESTSKELFSDMLKKIKSTQAK